MDAAVVNSEVRTWMRRWLGAPLCVAQALACPLEARAQGDVRALIAKIEAPWNPRAPGLPRARFLRCSNDSTSPALASL